MCRKLLILFMVLGFVSSASAGLVLEWEFEDNTNDTAGSNHGTVVSGTATYVTGVKQGNPHGKAISLNGSTMVEKTGATGLPTAQAAPNDDHAGLFSINMWVWQDAAASICEVAGGFGNFAELNAHMYLGTYYSEAWFHGMNRTDVYPMPMGEWAMLTVVMDYVDYPHEGQQNCYINGVYQESRYQVSNDFAPNVRVGDCDGNPESDATSGWSGLVDGFQIYDHLLSQAEIDALYTPEPATICMLGLGGLALLRKRR